MPEIDQTRRVGLICVQFLRMYKDQSNVPWDERGKRNNIQCSFVTKSAEKLSYMQRPSTNQPTTIHTHTTDTLESSPSLDCG